MINQGKHKTNSAGKFKTNVLGVSLCNSGDVYRKISLTSTHPPSPYRSPLNIRSPNV